MGTFLVYLLGTSDELSRANSLDKLFPHRDCPPVRPMSCRLGKVSRLPSKVTLEGKECLFPHYRHQKGIHSNWHQQGGGGKGERAEGGGAPFVATPLHPSDKYRELLLQRYRISRGGEARCDSQTAKLIALAIADNVRIIGLAWFPMGQDNDSKDRREAEKES